VLDLHTALNPSSAGLCNQCERASLVRPRKEADWLVSSSCSWAQPHAAKEERLPDNKIFGSGCTSFSLTQSGFQCPLAATSRAAPDGTCPCREVCSWTSTEARWPALVVTRSPPLTVRRCVRALHTTHMCPLSCMHVLSWSSACDGLPHVGRTDG
jgi:hypothetical protein